MADVDADADNNGHQRRHFFTNVYIVAQCSKMSLYCSASYRHDLTTRSHCLGYRKDKLCLLRRPGGLHFYHIYFMNDLLNGFNCNLMKLIYRQCAKKKKKIEMKKKKRNRRREVKLKGTKMKFSYLKKTNGRSQSKKKIKLYRQRKIT